jgi:glycosyltransferase involved in cell wall biosynthesis
MTSKKENIVVGIDASRNRSGGAKSHLIGILSNIDFSKSDIYKVHVWSYRSLLDSLPENKFIVKHYTPELEKSLIRQIFWQFLHLPRELKKFNCNILFSSDASTFCRFDPMVVLSQDLLSYEPGIIRQYALSKELPRLLLILFLQNMAFRSSKGVIFLTNYASNIIQKSCGKLSEYTVIPHGSDKEYQDVHMNKKLKLHNTTIKCLYVSNVEIYKYQWIVVQAIAYLREKGYDISLSLIGDGNGKAKDKLNHQINKYDKDNRFINFFGFLDKNKILSKFEESDIFIFASGCEAFGIALLEAMSCGAPIASSNRSCIPELLKDGGVYFNPSNSLSIAKSVESLINNNSLRSQMSGRAKYLSNQYSWEKCSTDTWKYISYVYKKK